MEISLLYADSLPLCRECEENLGDEMNFSSKYLLLKKKLKVKNKVCC